MVSIERWSQI